MNQEKILDVSWGTIFKAVLGFLFVYLLFLVKDILILVVFAIIVSLLFEPAIEFLERLRFPRVLAASLIYLFFLSLLGFSIYLVSLSFIPEIKQFSGSFSEYFEKISLPLKDLGFETFSSLETFIASLEGWLVEASINIFTALSTFFGGIFATFTIFSIAFFLSLEGRWTERVIKSLFPKKHEEIALKVWQKSQEKVSSWFGTRLIGCLFISLASFLVLKLFKVDYAVSLSFFAGVLDIVPFLGPMVAGILITILISLENWLKAVFVLIAFILIQKVEESIVVPLLSKKFIGLPPALVTIALIVGGKLWGLLGVVFAIPLIGILFEFLKDYFEKKKERNLT